MTTDLIHDDLHPYSDLVRRHFACPVHAGDLEQASAARVSAVRSESEHGATLEMAMQVDDGTILSMRFRVFGCPYLIAAAEWVCAYYEGRLVTDLKLFAVDEIMRLLQVPIEKTGRILLLEDTLLALSAALDD
jgi:nitrogen fixation NifU-like protein